MIYFQAHLSIPIKIEFNYCHDASKTLWEGTVFLRQAVDKFSFKFQVDDSIHWWESLLTLQLA